MGGAPWFSDSGGDGPVLLALHPGGTDSRSLAPLLEHLAGYRSIAPDRAGHGRTADIDGPWTFEGMADEAAVLLDGLGLRAVHVLGWSDGAIVGLHLLLRRPDLVRSLVFGSAVRSVEGWRKGVLEGEPPQSMGDAYGTVSPDGREHWPLVVAKSQELHRASPRIGLDAVRTVRAPVLVVTGDDDEVRLEHLIELFEALPDGELAVVPRSTHGLIVEKPALLARLVREFHDPDRSDGLAPMRRRPQG